MAAVDLSLNIGRHQMKNRIAFAPTVKFFWSEEGGKVSERSVRHYEDRAKGGAGLVVVEATCVTPDALLGVSQLGLWDDGQIAGHKAIADACHRHGTLVLVQLHHAGIQTPANCIPPEGLFGPSAIDWHGTMTKEMSVQQIHKVRAQFVEAAIRAKKAGCDGVQLHGCHLYLLNQFVSPAINQRTDEYGGDTDGRCRLSCEIIRGVRAACGEDFIISVRTTGAEPTVEESCAIADRYIDAGVDMLQVSLGFGSEAADCPARPELSATVRNGAALHRHVNGRVPVSVVGGIIEPELARFIIENDMADIVDAAKALLADPNWSDFVINGTECELCRACKFCLWTPMGKFKCPAVAARRLKDRDCADYFEAGSEPG